MPSARSFARRAAAGVSLLPLLLAACGDAPGAADIAQNDGSGRPDVNGQRFRVRLETPDGPHSISVEARDGDAVFEGDMIIGPLDDVLGTSKNGLRAQSFGIEEPSWYDDAFYPNLWPNGFVPYTIGSGFSDAEKLQIEAAIDLWQERTHIRFKLRTTEDNYAVFTNDGVTGCSSDVGKSSFGLSNKIKLGAGCLGIGTIAHEIGHTLGLRHEQARPDRDDYVRILWDNILDGKESNFEIHDYNHKTYSPYDFGSVMHYSGKAFSKNGLPTIERKDGGAVTGQRSTLSAYDVYGMMRLYERPPSGTVKGRYGKCLDVKGGDDDEGNPTQIYKCNGDEAQKWTYEPAAQRLRSAVGVCLESPTATPANGARLQTSRCDGGANQTLRMTNIQVRGLAGKCLESAAASPANGTRARTSICNDPAGNATQEWTYTAARELRLRSAPGMCLDVAGGATASGTPVQVFACNGSAAQKWNLTPGGAIKGIGGLCLDVAGGNVQDGAVVQQYTCNGSASQVWSLRGEITGPNSRCMNVRNGGGEDGNPVDLRDCSGRADPNKVWDYYF